MKSFWRLVACLAVANIVIPVHSAFADIQIVPSIAAVDESDDILKPGIGLKTYFNGFGGSVWGWGRDYGPVQQRSVLLTLGKYWAPFSFKNLTFGGGVSVLSETTRLIFKDAKDENHEDTFYNGGGFLGLRYSYSLSKMVVDASWESGVFPAGIGGGLFLATGRKQIVSIGLGAML